MGSIKFDDLDNTKQGAPDQFYKLSFTKFHSQTKFQKWDLEVHHDTFMKIIGTQTPQWKIMEKDANGKWIEVHE